MGRFLKELRDALRGESNDSKSQAAPSEPKPAEPAPAAEAAPTTPPESKPAPKTQATAPESKPTVETAPPAPEVKPATEAAPPADAPKSKHATAPLPGTKKADPDEKITLALSPDESRPTIMVKDTRATVVDLVSGRHATAADLVVVGFKIVPEKYEGIAPTPEKP